MAKSKHDPFFARSLEHPSIAKDFFKHHVPIQLKAYINWEALSRIDRSNTDVVLKKLHRDILYTTLLEEGRAIILGAEHQSKEDPMMPIRYLRYDADILEAYIKKGHTKWPLIINL